MDYSMIMQTRRNFLLQASGLASGLGFGLLAGPSWAIASAIEPTTFIAYRNDSLFGYHKLNFTESGPRLTVDIEIAFDYKLAFIPLYRYRHRNREIWEDGRLVALTTETDDDGTNYRVEAKAEGDRLLVSGSGGKLILPAGTPSTSYWNEKTLERGEWLDTQNGKLARSTVTSRNPEPIMVAGKEVIAKAYDLAGDITCTLWYHNDRWVKLRFIASDQSIIEYTIDMPGRNG
ncbi:MAG: DUF6134 family protein [Geminicoccaceae bacterium]